MSPPNQKKLRLLLFEQCNRSCKGCCNKQWDLKAIPKVTNPEEYADYGKVILTGGEPLLYPGIVVETIEEVRKHSNAVIYLYTSCLYKPEMFRYILNLIDGICVTFHDKQDPLVFKKMIKKVSRELMDSKSMRLNVFRGINIWETLDIEELKGWSIKEDIVWIDSCPLPENEVFKRLPSNKVTLLDNVV